jgi:UDP-N-acetylmuramate dehydrogenase
MMTVEENVSLSRLTTLRVGGSARYLLAELDADEVGEAVQFARERGLPLIPLGAGSNVLAPDEGIDAVFVRFGSHAIRHLESVGDSVTVSVDAGCLWDAFVERAVQEGWWGIENLTSIPGTVGAAVVQNIGAYGAALEETVLSVEAFDTKTGARVSLSNSECSFGYRTSVFKAERDRYLITAVTFRLGAIATPRLSYKDVSAHFASSGEEPTLLNIRRIVARIREGKFPPLAEYGTAGSFFLNPVVSADDASAIQSRFPGMPLFPMPEGGVKVPLAWILDRALALKGLRVGGAFLWEAQPLVIAADAGARSSDVIALADMVREKVKTQTGIVIFPEVRILE